MIKNIKIAGFKSFDYAELNFKNFTLLAGANSVGKTSVLQSIFALLQRGNNPFRGEYMNVGKFNELINIATDSNEIKFEMQYGCDDKTEVFSKIITKESISSSAELDMKCNVVYCSAERIGVKDTYEKYMGDEIHIGKNCEYVFHYLAEHKDDSLDIEKDFIFDVDSKYTFGGQVDYWLSRILGYRIKANEIEKTEFIQVLYTKEKMAFEMRPKNVGTGVTYIAELIIAALACRSDDLLIIENPEIHLHPSGQAELVNFLACLAQNGIQIILETHSDHIYNGIRRAICQDIIDCENVGVYFFTQDERGCSNPIEIPVSEEGKALQRTDGLFDQIDKDLDVILGW